MWLCHPTPCHRRLCAVGGLWCSSGSSSPSASLHRGPAPQHRSLHVCSLRCCSRRQGRDSSHAAPSPARSAKQSSGHVYFIEWHHVASLKSRREQQQLLPARHRFAREPLSCERGCVHHKKCRVNCQGRLSLSQTACARRLSQRQGARSACPGWRHQSQEPNGVE